MDVLYVYRDFGDSWDLRYSLRSRAANMVNVGRVIVIGDPPDWLSGEVVKVRCPHPYDRGQKNILFAIMNAMAHSGVAGPCLYSSDDHFVMKPFDADNLPWFARQGFWSRFPTEQELYGSGRTALNNWRGSMVATGNLFRRIGWPVDNWSGHFDTHLDGRDLGTVMSVARGWETSRFAYEPSSLFIAAARMRDPSIRSAPVVDVKLLRDFDARGCEERMAVSSGFMSAAETRFMPRFRRWMELRFPEPCRWEKT